MKNFILDKLEEFNDSNFKFEPIAHKYTYNDIEYTSVTRFIQQFHKPFDQDYWSKYKAKQADVPQEEILAKWQDLNDSANIIGTEMHNYIELYYKKQYQEIPNNLDVVDRINKFNIIYAKHLFKLEPVAFEIKIFSKKWNIAGMIDSIFLLNNKIYIIDWKSNKKFTIDNRYHEYLLSPFNEHLKSHLTEYSIQISLYALILEEYGLDIAGGYLVHIGPETDAQLHKVIDMRHILKKFLNKI